MPCLRCVERCYHGIPSFQCSNRPAGVKPNAIPTIPHVPLQVVIARSRLGLQLLKKMGDATWIPPLTMPVDNEGDGEVNTKTDDP